MVTKVEPRPVLRCLLLLGLDPTDVAVPTRRRTADLPESNLPTPQPLITTVCHPHLALTKTPNLLRVFLGPLSIIINPPECLSTTEVVLLDNIRCRHTHLPWRWAMHSRPSHTHMHFTIQQRQTTTWWRRQICMVAIRTCHTILLLFIRIRMF